MQAAWYEAFGSAAEVLQSGDRPSPAPSAGEVLVRVAASGINPSDVKKRAGSFPNLLDDGYVIPNSDGAGVIEAVGDGVRPGRVGERVWVYQAQYGRRFGTAAEFVAIDSTRAPPLPANTEFTTGACLGIPAMTAHRTVFADGDVRGQTLLVTGGAGRVGHYAIQWAHQAGARVIATASNDQDVAACERAGANATVDHRQADWSDAVLENTRGTPVDRVIEVELGANLESVLKIVKTGGVIATYSSTQISEPVLPFYQMMYMDLTVRFVIVYAMPESAKQHAVDDISQALTGNRLQHRIADTRPLHDIVSASELIEGGSIRGSVVLTMN